MYLTGKTYRELKDVFDKLAVGADPMLLDDLRHMPFGIYDISLTSTESTGSSEVKESQAPEGHAH